mgnify:CR=1 FL=1
MPKLSRKEVDALVNKVRAKFKEYAKKYGENKFNVGKFNARYIDALTLKVDIEHFLYAEITALEQLARDIDETKKNKLEEIRMRKEIRKQLDDIADAHANKIKSYPDYYFHEKTPYDISKLMGALFLYYKELLPSVIKAVKHLNDIAINNELIRFEHGFDDYCLEKKKGVTAKIQDFALVLDKHSNWGKVYEREEQKFIQDAGVFINAYLSFLKRVMKNYIIDTGFENKYLEFFKANIDFITKMIEDFRLSAFKKKNFFRLGQ